MMGGRTINCHAGKRCAYGSWHLACLSIEEERGIEEGLEWWCPHCRVKFPEEAKTGTVLQGEKLNLGLDLARTWDEDGVEFGLEKG